MAFEKGALVNKGWEHPVVGIEAFEDLKDLTLLGQRKLPNNVKLAP